MLELLDSYIQLLETGSYRASSILLLSSRFSSHALVSIDKFSGYGLYGRRILPDSKPKLSNSLGLLARSYHRALHLFKPRYSGYSLDPHIEPFTYQTRLHRLLARSSRRALHLLEPKSLHTSLPTHRSQSRRPRSRTARSSSSSKFSLLIGRSAPHSSIFISMFSFIASIAISS